MLIYPSCPSSFPTRFTHYHDWQGASPAASVLDRYKNEVNRCHSVLETRLKEQKAKGSDFIALDRVTYVPFSIPSSPSYPPILIFSAFSSLLRLTSIADYAFHGWLRIVHFAKMSLDDYPTLKAYAAKLEESEAVQKGSKNLGDAIANHKSKQ
jgi:glutathione S-transferase